MRFQDIAARENGKRMTILAIIVAAFVLSTLLMFVILPIAMSDEQVVVDVFGTFIDKIYTGVIIAAVVSVELMNQRKRKNYWKDYYVLKGKVKGVCKNGVYDGFTSIDFVLPDRDGTLTLDAPEDAADGIREGDEIVVIRFRFQAGKKVNEKPKKQLKYIKKFNTPLQEYHMVY